MLSEKIWPLSSKEQVTLSDQCLVVTAGRSEVTMVGVAPLAQVQVFYCGELLLGFRRW